MDWLQFFASIIGSLAWPSVVVALLFMLRGQMAGLVGRLEELAFGGAKAKFAMALEQGKANTEQLAATLIIEGRKTTSDNAAK
jgi:hypothetical protein